MCVRHAGVGDRWCRVCTASVVWFSCCCLGSQLFDSPSSNCHNCDKIVESFSEGKRGGQPPSVCLFSAMVSSLLGPNPILVTLNSVCI